MKADGKQLYRLHRFQLENWFGSQGITFYDNIQGKGKDLTTVHVAAALDQSLHITLTSDQRIIQSEELVHGIKILLIMQ
jgi:hypothetical protein